MADKKRPAERWLTFVATRFFPQFLCDFRASLAANVLGAVMALLIVLAQIHYGVIKPGELRPQILSIAWPYGLLILALVVYHAARTPWLISNEQLDSIKLLEQAKGVAEHELADREDTIRRLTEKPPRTAAEEHDHEVARKALLMLGDKGTVALRHLRRQGSITFDYASCSAPLSGLSLQDLLSVYRHCASEGVLNCKTSHGNSDQTFTIAPKMEKALEELLYGE